MNDPSYICTFCKKKISGQAYISGSLLLHTQCMDAYLREQDGYKWECPKCKKSGKVKDPSGATQEKLVPLPSNETYPICAYADCRGCELCREGEGNYKKIVQVPVYIKCDLCDGYGYLKKEPVPHIKIVVEKWSFRD